MSASAQAFRRIYETNLWGFSSGHGSLPSATKDYRKFLETFLRENRIGTVVDFGCGDWQFSRLIDWSGADYLGLDVHDPLIRRNRSRYARQGIRFELSPDEFSAVPAGELLLVKDVLQHFSGDMIREFMAQVVPRFRYALITNCVEPAGALNQEIDVGGWRPLDLRAKPFLFDVPAVLSLSGSAVVSFRKLRAYPGWRKVVLLFSNSSSRSASRIL